MSHPTLIVDLFKSNKHSIYVNAVEAEEAHASPDHLSLSVEFVVYHKICSEPTKLRAGDMVGVLAHRCFDEPIATFATEDTATSAILDMVEALELPFRMDGDLLWQPDMTAGANEMLEGVDDMAVRVWEIARRRQVSKVGVVMVVETVLPPWLCMYGHSSAAPAA